MKRLRIYLSSTFEDLKEYRAAVFAALEKAGLDVARMEAYTAADERPLDLCLRDVGQSDIYVGLYAWRYGYEPPAAHGNPQSKSITELEYRHAESKKLRKLIFFAHPDTKAHWPDRFKDEVTGEGNRGEKLNSFRRELGTEKSATFFRMPDELATSVLAAILRGGLSGRPYNVPPRLAGFVPRASLTNALIDAIVGTSPHVPGIHTVVHGAGGIGKTSLAINVCHLPEIVSAFPDGILWTTLGERPELARAIADLHALVTGSTPQVVGMDAIAQTLTKALAGWRCLLVVDDVWRAEDLRYFCQLEGPQLLVTTRVPNLLEQAGQIGWREVQVDQMEIHEAATLLSRGFFDYQSNRDLLRGLADRLGCWPLLIDLVNARLLEEQKARQASPQECIERVTKLFERRGVLGFDRRDSKARNNAVERSVQVGLEFAEEAFPGIAEKAAWISIFPEDIAIPVRVLAELWEMDELSLEEEVARPLNNINILRWDRQRNEVRLHDMIQGVLAARLANPAMAHRTLVETWRDPYHLPHDYAWRWFGWHSVRANQQDRLLRLLLDLDWLREKLAATEINSLLGEFDQIRDEPLAKLIQGACLRSGYVLANDKSQLAGQLLARIPEHEKQMRDRILERSLVARKPWLRPLTASLAGERSIRWLRPAQGELLDSVVLSRNGQWAAYVSGPFGSEACNVVLWDLKQWESCGPRFHTLAQLNPFALALSDDGRWCLYADSVGGVHRLDALGSEVWHGHAHGDVTIAKLLAITADGQRALSASRHERLIAWDIDAGQHEIVHDESENFVEALDLDPTGSSGVVALTDGSVVLIDLWPARPRNLFALGGTPSALARSSDNSLVAAATKDGRIEVRSVNFLDSPNRIFTSQEEPTSLAVSSNNRYLGVGTEKGTLEIWNIETGTLSARYPGGHTYEVERIVFSHDNIHVISADSLQIKEWAVDAADNEEGTISLQAAGQVKVTANGSCAVSVLKDGRLGVWNIYTGTLKWAISPPPGPAFGDLGIGPPLGLTLAAKGARVLAWNQNLLCMWDIESNEAVRSLSIEAIRDAALTPDGKTVVYVNRKNVSCWTVDDGKSHLLGTYDSDPPRHVAISPDGRRALTSGGKRAVFEWRLDVIHPPLSTRRKARDTAKPIEWWISSRDKPSIVTFTNPEEAIVTTGDGSLFMLTMGKDIQRRRQPEKFAGEHASSINRVLVTYGGRSVVTSSYDVKVMIWDVGTRQCIGAFDAYPGNVEQVANSARRALLSTRDGVLRIVSLPDGAVVAAFQGDKQIITCAGDAELQWVVACDQGGQMHFLHMEERT